MEAVPERVASRLRRWRLTSRRSSGSVSRDAAAGGDDVDAVVGGGGGFPTRGASERRSRVAPPPPPDIQRGLALSASRAYDCAARWVSIACACAAKGEKADRCAGEKSGA